LLGDSTDTTPRTFTATTTTTWINTFSSVNGATLDNVSMKRA
jgi:hypothetical protein